MHASATILDDDDPRIFGRERERSGLGALLNQARDGAGLLVLIGGQAGIGKTTLVQDLARRAAGRGMLALAGYCYDLTTTPPYSPWMQIVRMSMRVGKTPSAPAPLLDESVLGQTYTQQMLFQELEAYLVEISELQPLVLVLEDLHWSDRESLAFLRWFGHQIAHLPVLIVVTYRDDELTRTHPLYEALPALVRESGAHRVNLKPLNDLATRSLIASRYRLPATDEAALVAYLRDRADGNPFFLGELLRALEEEQRIYPTDGSAWAIGDLGRLSVPPLVRQVIDSRLNRLGEEVRAALESASVIGQDVPFALWSAVSGVPEDELATVVARAVDAHLLTDARDGTRLRFPHALVREAIYERLLLPRRIEVHRQMAEILMRSPGVVPDTIAHHLQEAGDPRAVDWFIQAGVRAERIAWLTAAEHFRSALQLMRQHDTALPPRAWLIIRLVRLLRFSNTDACYALLDEADRYASDLRDDVLRAYADFCRAEVDGYSGRLDTRAAMLAQANAVDRLRRFPAADRRRLDALIDSGEVVTDATFLAMLVAGLSQSGHATEAIDLGIDVIRRYASPPPEAPWGLSVGYTLIGDLPCARDAYCQARNLFISLGDYSMAGSTALYELTFAVLPFLTDDLAARAQTIAEGEDAWNRARGAQGNAARLIHLPAFMLEGEWQAALALLNEARSRLMTFGRRAIFLTTLGQIARAQGNTTLAWSLLRETYADDIDSRPGPIVHITSVLLYQLVATLLIDTRDLDTAQLWLEAIDDWLAIDDTVFGRADTQLIWADWHQAAGDVAAVRTVAAQALTTASEPRQPLALLRAQRLLGELELAAEHWEIAEHALQGSLLLAEACRAPYERGLTLMALAELRGCTTSGDEAGVLLNDARESFTRLGAEPALRRLSALATDLSTRPATISTYPAGLTAREVDVLQLVAAGMTNAQVAGQLFVSRRTIDQHLRSIYGKLGVSSRAAATRYAVEHGLV